MCRQQEAEDAVQRCVEDVRIWFGTRAPDELGAALSELDVDTRELAEGMFTTGALMAVARLLETHVLTVDAVLAAYPKECT